MILKGIRDKNSLRTCFDKFFLAKKALSQARRLSR